ncbi:MAG: hypothetical protein EOM74_01075 [Methanomicrobia archaeon]|nr:hypothetical protein [Methanomicrobia archaeon]
MAILNNQSFECKLYKRVPNSAEAQETGIIFYAELISNNEISQSPKLTNLRVQNARFMLRTSSTNVWDFSDGKLEKGYVLFQGGIYQIQTIEFDYNQAASFGAGRFSKEYAERNAIKILVLV